MRRHALEDRGEPAVQRQVALPLVVGVERIEIGGDAGEARAQLVVGAAGVQLQRHLVVEEEVVERRRPLQVFALAVEEREMRPVELVGRAQVEIDVPRLHVDRAVRRVGDAVHAGERARIVDRAHQRRHVGETAGDVGAMAEADEARALVQQRGEALRFERETLPIEAPLAHRDACCRQLAPGADVRLVIEIGDDDLVSLAQAGPERLGEEEHVHRGRRPDHHLLRRGVDHRRHRPVAFGDHLGGAGRRGVGRARLHLIVGHVGADAIQRLGCDEGAARVLEQRPRARKRGEVRAGEGGIERRLRRGLTHAAAPSAAIRSGRRPRSRPGSRRSGWRRRRIPCPAGSWWRARSARPRRSRSPAACRTTAPGCASARRGRR